MKDEKQIRSLIDEINAKKPVFNGAIRAVQDETRADGDTRFELSFSSEAEYERWFGIEVLGHNDGEVRMDWINSGNAPLLLQHDHNQLIGVIESANIEGGRGTAVVRFGSGALAQEIKQDVAEGIRTNVSVGYRIHKMVLTEKAKEGAEKYRVTDWEPFEVSSVSVPADMTVGTNRADEAIDAPDPEPIQIKENTMDKQKELAKSLGLNEDASLDSIMEAQARKAEKTAQTKLDTELARQSAIRELASVHRDKISDMDARAERAIKDGISLESVRREVLDCYTDGTAKVASAPSFSKQEQKDLSAFSIVKAIREQASGKLSGLEAEVHAEGEREAKANGLTVGGYAIPSTMMRAGEVTVTGEGADLVATGITGFIELLRNKMIINQLGARSLMGLSSNVLIPKMTAGATGSWEGEIDANAKSTPTFGQLALSPKRVGTYTEISKKLLMQSTPDVEALIRDDLATGIALAIDLAAIHGTGANDQPTGIVATAGIGSVAGGTNGLAPAWSHIVDLETAVAVDNADVGNLSYLTNAVVRGKLKQTAKVASTDSQMIWADGATPLNGYGCGVSNQVASDLDKGTSTGVCSAIVFGDFSQLLVAGFGGLDLVVDPYTLATTNLLKITANTYADIGVRHAESFAAMLDALTA